mgnify:CR=1 FL=1
MGSADLDLIRWLLNESSVSRYRIAKDTGIAESTIGRISRGAVSIDKIQFGIACKLTDYARQVQRMEKEVSDT